MRHAKRIGRRHVAAEPHADIGQVRPHPAERAIGQPRRLIGFRITAADIGMRTVWIRTDESVKRAADADLSHIHHQTDDLATWLDDWLTERNLKT